MDKTPIALSVIELPAPSGEASVPEWVHLIPKGEFRAVDGRGPWRYEDAAEVIRLSFASHKRLHIDLNHSTETAGKLGLDAPAVGYIVEMEEREDGIWGRVDWTRRGTELLSDRAYWGISPVILPDAKGKLTAIARAALTNDPAVRNLTPLSRKDQDPMLQKLAKMLGLAEDATEEQVMAALEAKLAADKPDSEALSAALSPIAVALGVEGDATPEALVATAKGLKAGAGEQAETLTALQARLDKLETGGKQAAAEAFIDKAIADKRVGVKGARAEYVALHVQNPEQAEKIINSLPQLGATHTTLVAPAAKDGAIALSAEQTQAAKLLGIPAEEYLKTLKSERDAQEAL